MTYLVSNWQWLVTGAVTGFIAYCNLPSTFLMPIKSANLGTVLFTDIISFCDIGLYVI